MKRTPLPRKFPMKRRPKKMSREEVDYAEWIRTQKCVGCISFAIRQRTPSEAAHTGGLKAGSGTALKSHWSTMVPLCSRCHRTGPDAHHGADGATWFDRRGIDLESLYVSLMDEYGKRNNGG